MEIARFSNRRWELGMPSRNAIRVVLRSRPQENENTKSAARGRQNTQPQVTQVSQDCRALLELPLAKFSRRAIVNLHKIVPAAAAENMAR